MNIINAQMLFGKTLILANKIQTFGDSIFDDFTLKQWFLLVTIKNIPEQDPNVQTIAEISGTSRQNIKKMLDILSAKGYVRLTVSQSDRRALSVSLTEKTKDYLDKNEEKGVELTKYLFEGISDSDIDTANKVSLTMLENLNKMEKHYEKI
ncbi:MAG: MarR family transcriptional regulator [Oscillospiraceae bacterium]|nr:MarR family transcriptional regulator [Oscillospiraceae bacterium]